MAPKPALIFFLPSLLLTLTLPVAAQQAPAAKAASPWSCYAGGSLGYGSVEQTVDEVQRPRKIKIKKGGGLLGGEFGCDYGGFELPNIGPIVIGSVLDVSFGKIQGTKERKYTDFGTQYEEEYKGVVPQVVLMRVRVGGIPSWNENLFLYGTVGMTWVKSRIEWKDYRYIPSQDRYVLEDEADQRETLNGWVFGGGVEFEPEWVKAWGGKIGVEYLYAGLEADTDYTWEESGHTFRAVFRKYF